MILIATETTVSYIGENVVEQFKIIMEQLRNNPKMFKTIYVRPNPNKNIEYKNVKFGLSNDGKTMFMCFTNSDKQYLECVGPDVPMMIHRISHNSISDDGSDNYHSERYQFEFEDKKIDLYM